MDEQQPGLDPKLEKRRRTNKRILKVFGGIVGVFVVLTIIGAIVGGGDSTDTSSDAAASAATSAPAADATSEAAAPETTAAADESAPKTPQQRVQAAVADTNADGAKAKLRGDEVTVTFNVGDNLTNGLIRTGIAMDTFDLLKAVKQAHVKYGDVKLVGKFPLVDKYGNNSKGTVYQTWFARSTVNKINFDNVAHDMDSVEALADGLVMLHPDLRK